jgi:hypothetical protein
MEEGGVAEALLTHMNGPSKEVDIHKNFHVHQDLPGPVLNISGMQELESSFPRY